MPLCLHDQFPGVLLLTTLVQCQRGRHVALLLCGRYLVVWLLLCGVLLWLLEEGLSVRLVALLGVPCLRLYVQRLIALLVSLGLLQVHPGLPHQSPALPSLHRMPNRHQHPVLQLMTNNLRLLLPVVRMRHCQCVHPLVL